MEETFVGNGYVYGINRGDAFMGTYFPQTHLVVYIKDVQLFACQSCLSKVV